MRERSRNLVLVIILLLAAMTASADDGGSFAVARPGGRLTPVTNATTVIMTGSTSWGTSASTATIRVDGVKNTSGSTSGPLRLVLFFSSTKYPAAGTNAAVYNFGPLAAGATQSNVGGTVPFNPPAGCSYRALLLQEQVASVWETAGYVTYISMCSFAPTHGPSSGGTTVTVTGKDLARVTGVTFDGINAPMSTHTETQIVVTSPAHVAGNVTFRLSDGSGYSSDTWTYDANPPVISSISPTHGPAAGGNNVTISGSVLDTVTSVKFDTTEAVVVSKTATQIVAKAPAHAAGVVTLRVEGPGGSATKPYTYDDLRPEIRRITPDRGPTAGGQTVTVTGKNFAAVTSVAIGGTSATVQSKTDTTIIVTTPPHEAAQVSLQLRSPNGNVSGDYTYFDGAGELRMLAVVGSLAGNLGSFFRTALQLTNPGTTPLNGTLTFHKQGQPPSPSDPSLAYTLPPGATTAIPDVLPAMNTSGIGSLDLQAANGQAAPLSLARVFNDGGSAGTTGMTIDLVTMGEALAAGSSAVLLAPSDLTAYRFNVGVRALDKDVTMNVVTRNAAGAVVRTTQQQYPAGSFTQVAAATVAGGPVSNNDSLTFELTAGSALIYGSTTDNITQDPSYQAARVVPLDEAELLVIPVAGSAAGNFNSFFRTATQIHNPTGSELSVKVVFHPQGQSGSDSDPSTTITLQAHETRFFADIVASLKTSGLGSLDFVPQSGETPLVLARIYNDAGSRGTTGMTLEALSAEAALQGGETSLLIAPASSDFRYNVGVRTLEATTLQLTLRDAAGTVKKTTEVTYPANYFTQVRASDLVGAELSSSDTIGIRVVSGAAFLYGSTTDNRTQDPSVQMAGAN